MLKNGGVLLGASMLFVIVQLLLFHIPTYRALLDPASSTASFEAAIAQLRTWTADPKRDVLVLGDSRIYAGLDPAVASKASSTLRFLNAGVPGTTPRCWYFFARAIDPDADRFRAVVIPVDSYSDDSSAIGSLDADDHAPDLRYVVYETRASDIVPLARSFNEPELQRTVAFDLALRGPVLREDFQSLLLDPLARLAAIRATANSMSAYRPDAWHPFRASLAAMQVDFHRNAIVYPAWVDARERTEMAKEVLDVPRASPSYAAYRERWFGPIVARYRAAHVPIVFVRLPTRPAHRAAPVPPMGSIPALAAAGDVTLIPQEAYVALERPELFADHDHLNREGSERFSATLGRDVARALEAAGIRNAGFAPQVPLALRAPAATSRLHEVLTYLRIGVPMPFQSVDFWLFFGIVAAAFFAVPGRLRFTILLLGSYYFYVRWNASFVGILAGITLSDFAIALLLERETGRRRILILSAGIAVNLLFLGTFKYLNFFESSFEDALRMPQHAPLVSLIVPIGISFHTFQSMSYLIDVSRGRMRAIRSLHDYALYIAFFPQLLAGPIVRAERFFRELYAWRSPSGPDVEAGIRDIAFGLVKKLAIADQFAPYADAYFAAPAAHPGALAAWTAAFSFAMQIYFDFSGYSDIAIGCARLLGFAFPRNFLRPYLAISISEFWRRWNITLSNWFRDYLYVPLGGNRAGTLATYRNLMITMLCAGLWHGANWTFVVWGAYHGALLVFERVVGLRAKPRHPISALARVTATFLLVLIGWVLFRAASFADAGVVLRSMLTPALGGTAIPLWLTLAVFVAWLIAVAQERDFTWMRWATLPRLARCSMLCAFFVALELCSWSGETIPFVYFKF